MRISTIAIMYMIVVLYESHNHIHMNHGHAAR